MTRIEIEGIFENGATAAKTVKKKAVKKDAPETEVKSESAE